MPVLLDIEGATYFKQKNYIKSHEAYKEASDIEAHNLDYYNNRAMALYKLEKYQ